MHTINIIIHVTAGTLALVVGLAAIVLYRRPGLHRRVGRWFLYLLTVVVTTGFIGWLFFRSDPFLLILTLLSGYVGYAGWRVMRLREAKPKRLEAGVPLIVMAVGIFYLLWLLGSDFQWSPTVVYSTLGALMLVTVYDFFKIVLFHKPLRSWWVYEHIYKMISAFSAILSAFTGTVLSQFHPYSQVLPSVLGTIAIVVFIVVERRKRALNISIP